MFEESSEPIVPEQSYSKRASSSIISFQTHHSKQNPFIDASTLVNNASSSTINAPALGRSTRVSSTIMTGK